MAWTSDYLQELRNSKGFLFSNVKVLLAGGLLMIVPVYLISIALQGGLAIACPVFIVSIVIQYFCIGYCIRCMRSVYRGETVMPPMFRDRAGLTRDAFAFLRISVVYAVFSLIFIFIIVLPFRHQTEPAIMILSKLVLSAYLVVMAYFLFISLAVYVAKDKVLVATHPANVIGIIRIDPVAALTALGVIVLPDILILVLAAFIQYANPWLPSLYGLDAMGIYYLAMSWVSFFILVLNAYVFGKLYLYAEAKSGALILPTEKTEPGRTSG